MPQFGAGPALAAQCPTVPPPDGWRAWVDADGPVPDALAARAASLAADQVVPLGTTESYPLPGVTPLVRVEPRAWSRDASGALVEGCFRASGIYLPIEAMSAAGVTAPSDGLSRTISILTAASLAAGTLATVVALRGRGGRR
jgi:hypothetical protein